MMISTRMPAIAIEYDCRGGRKTQHFDDAYAGRRFYAAKLKANKHPVVKKVVEENHKENVDGGSNIDGEVLQ